MPHNLYDIYDQLGKMENGKILTDKFIKSLTVRSIAFIRSLDTENEGIAKEMKANFDKFYSALMDAQKANIKELYEEWEALQSIFDYQSVSVTPDSVTKDSFYFYCADNEGNVNQISSMDSLCITLTDKSSINPKQLQAITNDYYILITATPARELLEDCLKKSLNPFSNFKTRAEGALARNILKEFEAPISPLIECRHYLKSLLGNIGNDDIVISHKCLMNFANEVKYFIPMRTEKRGKHFELKSLNRNEYISWIKKESAENVKILEDYMLKIRNCKIYINSAECKILHDVINVLKAENPCITSETYIDTVAVHFKTFKENLSKAQQENIKISKKEFYDLATEIFSHLLEFLKVIYYANAQGIFASREEKRYQVKCYRYSKFIFNGNFNVHYTSEIDSLSYEARRNDAVFNLLSTVSLDPINIVLSSLQSLEKLTRLPPEDQLEGAKTTIEKYLKELTDVFEIYGDEDAAHIITKASDNTLCFWTSV